MGGRHVLANVDLLYFRAQSSSDTITLVWETETELDNLGFHLWRSQTNNQADAVRINSALIPSQVGGQPIGALYEYPDTNVQDQIIYSYWLESVDVNNSSQLHGPVQASLGGGSAINTPVPGGGGAPDPTNTSPPPTATTAASNPTSPPSNEPTLPPPNPTATTATGSSSPTAAPTQAAPTGAANNPLPTATQPAADIQTAGSLEPTNDAPPETPLDITAVTPIGVADATAIASNDAAPSVKATATFIAGQDLPAIGAQGTATPDDDTTTLTNDTQSGTGWRQTVAIAALIIGVLLTAGGGFALWFINRRKMDTL